MSTPQLAHDADGAGGDGDASPDQSGGHEEVQDGRGTMDTNLAQAPGRDAGDPGEEDDDDDEGEEGEEGGKRKHPGDGEGGSKKKRLQRSHAGDKNKGLRHFSMKVCNKVEEKMRTTYNEVADELVAEFVPNDGVSAMDQAYDEKNIRRRVYDALNVLMAMDIIAKEKKNITWRGLPTNARQEAHRLQVDADMRRERIEHKRVQLQELLTQQISFKHLIARNRQATNPVPDQSRVQLPFIIVNTSKQTVIDCEMAEDKRDIFFNFSNPFEIHDDNEILKRMGMHQCQLGDLPHLVPPALIPFTPQYQTAQQRAMHTHLPPQSNVAPNAERSALAAQGASDGADHGVNARASDGLKADADG
mmetsp:Transcript_22283/g.69623  ORF Transcript_22283/g.69623 Transcript_22283/m.69623 type:complete len:360 (+) Transcript_22283:97-1176(+)